MSWTIAFWAAWVSLVLFTLITMNGRPHASAALARVLGIPVSTAIVVLSALEATH